MRSTTVTLLILAHMAIGGRARPLEVDPGSPLWMGAQAIREELPGDVLVTDGGAERAVLVEALAGRYYDRARAALGSFDLAEAGAALGKAMHGAEGTVDAVGAWKILAGLGGNLPSPVRGLPDPVERMRYEELRTEAEALWDEKFARGAVSEKGLGEFSREVTALAARKAMREWPRERWTRKLLASPGIPPEALGRLAAGEKDGQAGVQKAYTRQAWARRAILEVVAGRGLEPRARLQRSVASRKLRFEGTVRVGKGEKTEGLVVSLAGGRLGTAKVGAGGSFSLEVELAKLGKILLSRSVLPINVVRNRKMVYQRSLAAGGLLEGLRSGGAGGTTRSVALGALRLPEASGTLEVRVPVWPRLLDGRIAGPPPKSGAVRLAGQKQVVKLSRWGTATFRNVRPGWRYFGLVAKDASGGILYRAFAFAEVKPGEKTSVQLQLPVAEAPKPRKQKSLWSVKKYMKDVADGYRAGKISQASFRRSIGETYRLHRNFYGHPKKDKKFAQDVAAAMREVLASVQPKAAKGGDLTPRLEAVESDLADLRAILPDTLQKENPAGKLEVQIFELSEGLFGETVSGEFRSGAHLQRALREGEESIDELVGLTGLLEDVLTSKLEKIGQTFRKIAQDYRSGYTIYHLVGFDYEDHFLKIAGEKIIPLEELLAFGRKLRDERVAQDLRARKADEESRLEARAARLERLHKSLDTLASECKDRLADWEKERKAAGKRWEGYSEARRETLQRWMPVKADAGDEARRVFQSLPARPEKPWPRGAADVPALAGAFAKTARVRELARSWKEVYEVSVKRRLETLYELGAGEEELAELIAMAPTARRKELNARMSQVFERYELPDLEGPTWPPEVQVRAAASSRKVLAAYRIQALAAADFADKVEGELDQLAGRLDPDRPETLVPVARGIEEWNKRVREKAPPAPLVEEIVPKSLRLDALALETRLKKLASGLGLRTAKLPADHRDYLKRRGWLTDGPARPPEKPAGEAGEADSEGS